MSALEELDLDGCRAASLSPLAHLPALREIHVSGGEAMDLSPLLNAGFALSGNRLIRAAGIGGASDAPHQQERHVAMLRSIEAVASQETTTAQRVTDLVSQDYHLSKMALKAVNSSVYNFPRFITSLTHAVVILGFNAIRTLAVRELKAEPGRVDG